MAKKKKKKRPGDLNQTSSQTVDDPLKLIDDDELPLGKASLKGLRDAAKGKCRGFVLLRKNSKVLALAVYRLGTLDKYVKQVRKIGVGKVFHGVIVGYGQKLEFRLSRRDGFKKEPVKKLVLREFIETEGGLKTKSKMVLVDKLPPIS